MAVFKARARTLDMLGRQQIAGIPTAVSELFKNAHDAYADRVEVDFFRENSLFLLRDDGLGMTREDFESRWLTLGTESKLRDEGLTPPPVDPSKLPRPIMGEKGIGRLAIAAIGPQVLVLTRAKRPTSSPDLVAAFINWGFFEIPGVDLDRIHIPIRTYPAGMLPSANDVQEMVQEVEANLRDLSSFAGTQRTQAILNDLRQFDLDPVLLDMFALGPSLSGEGCGTHFYIMPTSENLVSDLEEPDKNESVAEEQTSKMSKTLSGFMNTMTPGHPNPIIKTAFRDHQHPELFKEILETNDFFTPNDFLNADHYMKGTFNEFGQFNGTISIYGSEFADEVIPWPKAGGKPLECGPFSIELAYVPGEDKDSTLPKDNWLRLSQKLKKYGGLYVYRDNLRIQPYGDSDIDWLEIEKRRTFRASTYFFSYRRMFGVVDITQEKNQKLIEKAGREGFRDNKAYRQFRAILMNFFQQVAAIYFREAGPRSDFFVTKRAEINKARVASKQRDELARPARNAFERRLEQAFRDISEVDPREQVQAVIDDTTRAIEATVLNNTTTEANEKLHTLETIAKRRIRELREQRRVTQPPGIGLTPDLRRQLNVYRRELDNLEAKVFLPALNKIDTLINEASTAGINAVDRRKLIRKSIEAVASDAQRELNSELQSARGVINEVHGKVNELLSSAEANLNAAIAESLNKVDNINIFADDALVAAQRLEVEEHILQIATQSKEMLKTLQVQLGDLYLFKQTAEGPIQAADMTAAIEEELLALRERADADLELVQLGMAIEVINHEFTQTIGAIRTALRRLKAWADANEGLHALYQDLRTNFEHLDGYLNLFTPLHRRLYRTAIDFSGNDITTYLNDLFRTRLEKHEVTIQATEEFRNFQISGYPSTFYPVFVNLVDNAIYWLQDYRHPRIVKLDAQGNSLIISDTGPGIPLRDQGAIFEQGFTRRPGGRGLGLYIARDVLAKIGYELSLISSEVGTGATFRISPTSNDGATK